ncbi:MAG TPA: alpha/beta hydrolase [Paracoccaceae bacterium]|nr:alpha/beta hydrolase [Paracoccaceae bacterium]
MTDYARLIDGEMWAFIERTNAQYPPDAASLDVAGQRRVYDAMCRAFHAGRPEGVAAVDLVLAQGGQRVPVRRYAPGAPGAAKVVYLHGGGFVLGGLESHDDVCAELCAATGFEVVSADYRLAPEAPHPAAFLDARAVFASVAAEGAPVVLAGDSAGGNLAAAVAHAARGAGPRPAGQVLVYPGLGAIGDTGSYAVHAEAPMLARADLEFYRAVRGGGPGAERDPSFAPLSDADFSGLPPTVAVAAECDPLADDCAAYAGRIRAAGGRAHAWTEPGLVHGFLRARHMSGRARWAFWRICQAVEALGRGEWPYE